MVEPSKLLFDYLRIFNFANGVVFKQKSIFISTICLLLLVQRPDSRIYRFSLTSQAPLLQEHEVTRNFLCHYWQEFFGSLLIYNRTRGNNVQRNPLEKKHWYIYTPWLPNDVLRKKQVRIKKLFNYRGNVWSCLSYFRHKLSFKQSIKIE